MTARPLARDLADEVVALRSAELPAEVLGRAAALLLDFLGVAVGGAGEESSVALRRGLGQLALRGDCVVLGTDERLPAPQAALANGAAAHALEMDDTHQGGSIHLGAAVFPAALAAAQLAGASGDALLRAAVAGYEVAARLAMALQPAEHYARGFHPTGTCGAFGAAAAAGLLLGLDADGLCRALGIAGSQASGSMEFLADGAWTKRLHPGWSACAGLHAAALAAGGFRAPASILEGRFGFLHAYSGAPLVDAVTKPAGAGFEIMQTGIKPHACCRYMQAPIDATLALRASHGIDPAAVEQRGGRPRRRRVPDRVRAGGAEATATVGGRRAVQPALRHRRGPGARRGVAGGVRPRDAGRSRDHAAHGPRRRRARCRAGRAVSSRVAVVGPHRPRATAGGDEHVTHPLGDPERFPDAAALGAKFRSLARRALSAERVERLAAAAAALPQAPDVSGLLDAAIVDP